MEMVIFCGIQATGKSEFYRQNFYKTHIRLNLDMLKTRHREQILLEACLRAKQPVVIDNTNPTKQDRARYITAAQCAGFSVSGYYFQSRVTDAIARNAERLGNEQVPVPGILATHKKLELPAQDEGFLRLYYVSICDGGGKQFLVEDYKYEI